MIFKLTEHPNHQLTSKKYVQVAIDDLDENIKDVGFERKVLPLILVSNDK